MSLPEIGQQRAIIEGVYPEVDSGKSAIKRSQNEPVTVDADVFADGHDALVCMLIYRQIGASTWHEVLMEFVINDRWEGTFSPTAPGAYVYSVLAWVDHFKSWHRDMQKRIAANQDVAVDLLIGKGLVEEAAERATAASAKGDARRLNAFIKKLGDTKRVDKQIDAALDTDLYELMIRHADRSGAVQYDKELPLWVDRERARFSTWYEVFPRSTSPEPGRHGTFKDVEARLPYVASMGFDVLYLPPIHPVGITFRKGKNNKVQAEPDDVGSPWAIGGPEGGHKAIHPELGTLDDFRSLVQRAKEFGMEIALDIAFQCSPDHPYVTEHPEWFRHRPDGTIQYAENPPKKYQDIYPINFETSDWQALWEELKSVMLYWIKQGVRIFRVDNPHTKSLRFWEWAIADIRASYPDTIFLSEAFTRPKVMYRLAKLGFTQSYTYFTWRNEKWDLTEYFEELTSPPVVDFFRPNVWPNTPDILHAFLQQGGMPAFRLRLMLAATLSANYGIYGPAFELGENIARESGSEEYLDSEKYQIRYRDLNQPYSLKDLIAQVNQIRRENPALQYDRSLRFHPTDNDQIICYSKQHGTNCIITVVSLDPHSVQSGWVGVDMSTLGHRTDGSYNVHDLLTNTFYLWHTHTWNFVRLDPSGVPAHILRL